MYATKRPKGVKARYADSGTVLDRPTRRLTTKQQTFAELLASGKSYADAASQAGFKSKASSHRALQNPLVQQYLSGIRQEARAIAAYDLKTAMDEALKSMEFAYINKQCMAHVRAVELRAKLSGLLIDRVEVVTVDLRGSLDRAERRVLNVSASTTASTTLLGENASESTHKHEP